MLGLYIHIPFCASRCIYCGFYSTVPAKKKDERLSVEERYVNAICHEMELRAEKNSDNSGERIGGLSTIYLGGGTPSQLSFESLQKIFQTIDKVYHIGLEWDTEKQHLYHSDSYWSHNGVYPDDITRNLHRTCVPFLSIVSLWERRLSRMNAYVFLHRRHTADEVETAVKRLRKTNIENISVDLMFGFPNETLEEWKEDIERLLALDIEHISAYSLMYEEGTPLYRLLQAERSRIWTMNFIVRCTILSSTA